MSRGSRARVALLSSIAAIGCATTPPVDWRDAPPSTARPIATQLRAPPAPRRFDASMEEALTHFGAERRAVVDRAPAGAGWPLELQDVWLRLIAVLETGLAVDNRVDRPTLIRARVATEVELDLTTTRFGPTPPGVAERLGKVYGLIGHHIRELRARDRPRPSFDWPVSPIIVTSTFGQRQDPLVEEVRFHAGLDLAGRSGDVVNASGSGKVVYAGWLGNYGKAVVLEHEPGLETVYGHLRDILVRQGATVEGGDALGLMGSSGRSTGPHLHFEIRKNGAPIDPHDLLGIWADDHE